MLQNYNKIFTKRTVFSILLQQNPYQNLHKKFAYFTHPNFSKTKIEKNCPNYASKYGISFSDYCRVLCNGWKWRFRAKCNVQVYEPKRPGW